MDRRKHPMGLGLLLALMVIFTACQTADPKIAANENYERGVFFVEQRQYDNAIERFNFSIQQNPRADAYIGRGLAYIGLEDYESAIADFTSAIEVDGNLSEPYMYRGRAKALNADYDSAIEDYNQALELDDTNAQAFTFRGQAYAQLEENELALADFSTAIELDPENHEAYNSRGNYYQFIVEDLESAVADYENAIDLNNRVPEYHENLAGLYITLEQYDEAVDAYGDALRFNRDNPELHLESASAKELAGDDRGAAADRRRASDLFIRRAEEKLELDNLEGALADFSSALELNETSATAYQGRAEILLQLGEEADALEAFKRAGQLYTENNRVDNAIAVYNRVLELDDTFLEGYLNRGIAYRNRGIESGDLADFENSLLDLGTVVSEEPENPEGYYQRALLYIETSDADAVEAELQTAIELDPTNGIYINALGSLYATTEQLDEAITAYTNAIENNPDNPEFYINRATVYLDLEEFDNALEDYSTAIELDDGNAFAYIGRARVYMTEEEYDFALADLDEARSFYLTPATASQKPPEIEELANEINAILAGEDEDE